MEQKIAVSAITMLSLLGAFFGGISATAQAAQPGESPWDPVISAFAVKSVPASQALLQLSKVEHVPIGIVIQGEELCRTPVSYAAENTPASVIASGIAAQVRGYTAAPRPGSPLVVVGPISPTRATSQFLELVDTRYAVKGNLQMLGAMLWVHILAILHPDQGSAGSIPGSTNDRVFGLQLTNVSIEQILDQIAMETKGAWVLHSLPPELGSLGQEPPFDIFSDVGQYRSSTDNLCAPAEKTK